MRTRDPHIGVLVTADTVPRRAIVAPKRAHPRNRPAEDCGSKSEVMMLSLSCAGRLPQDIIVRYGGNVPRMCPADTQ